MIYLALIGATLLVVRSTIFAPVRRHWPALLGCAQCSGTWVGIVAGATGLATTGRGRAIDAVIIGCATGFLALLADGVLLRLLGDPESSTPKE